jgi:murein DD-endopeptidase MepM/ murein hydrolase activator NlpD
MKSVRLVAISVSCTSLFWLLAGALYWPYANGGAKQVVAEPAAAQTARPVVPADPVTAGSRRIIIPVEGVLRQSLVDTYEDSRAEGARQHDAIDIMAPEGTPVVAAAAGTVEKLFTSDEGGNTVYVRSADRTVIFYYAHLRNYAPLLREGDTVEPGDAIGTVGWTGNASCDAPHLHFAVSLVTPQASWGDTGTPINPYGLLQSGRY